MADNDVHLRSALEGWIVANWVPLCGEFPGQRGTP